MRLFFKGQVMPENYTLTPVELELMEILWRIGQGTVREVMANLKPNRDLAYTSVSTILRILQQKKILSAKKMGKQHIYIPCFSKQIFATHSVDKMIRQIFSGNSIELVAHLVDKKELSMDEITTIQTLLDAKKRK